MMDAQLQTFAVASAVREIRLTVGDVSALCPFNGRLDHYTLLIAYAPMSSAVETGSLRAYLNTFAGRAISCEDLAVLVADALAVALQTVVSVTARQDSRDSGILIEATAECEVQPCRSA